MKIKKPSQANQILQCLESGASLTAIDALKRFGCLRLAARIEDLRSEGHPILTTMVTKNDSRVARYSMP
jgi:hypothetical protein